MLTLDETQWRQLQAHDARQFAAAVCDRFLAERPELVPAPGRAAILARMTAAQDYAARIGLRSTPHVVRLMYLAADAPAIHDDPVVDAHLRKPSATPEQRLDDLLAVVRKQLERQP